LLLFATPRTFQPARKDTLKSFRGATILIKMAPNLKTTAAWRRRRLEGAIKIFFYGYKRRRESFYFKRIYRFSSFKLRPYLKKTILPA
jgi:hypothetical protein